MLPVWKRRPMNSRLHLWDRFPCDVLRHQLHLRALPPTLLHRRLRWFRHAARRPANEIIYVVIDPVPLTHWRPKRGGLLKTWLSTMQEDLTQMSGRNVYGL